MPYTVNQLAKLSGVSIRTLRFYDEIDLLKPAYHGANGYRYYEDEQLLILQQILFYRELGIELKQISKVLGRSDFDKIAALNTHRKHLRNELEKTKRLINTIDSTIKHLKGEKEMAAKDLYEGFSPERQEAYENQLREYGGEKFKTVIDQCKSKSKHWSKDEWQTMKEEAQTFHKEVVKWMEKNKSPSSSEVQAVIAKHYSWIQQFWTPNRESYIGLAQLYLDMPDYRPWFDQFHPDLLPFFASSMKIYAEKSL
ncbi:MAG: MerR family transcriptional regulator [Parachlamydiales bacterium]